jgi:glycosyltransferase involved in cell wall biosynthesis
MVSIDKIAVNTLPRSKIRDEIIRQARPTSHPDLVVVIPAFNEARFIGSVVLQARQFTNQVIVIDDGSTDNTAGIARSAGASVICHECNQGKGAALNTGFQAARQFEPQVLVCLDGDGQHHPEDIELLIEPIKNQVADIVVGSRYLASVQCVPRSRVWGHRIFNLLTKYTSGVESSDSQSGFRAFSPRAIHTLNFCSKDFSVESEMQFLAQAHNLRVIEVRVTIEYPDPPKRSVLVHGMWVLNGILRLVGQHRPLLYFGVSGMVILSTGLLMGIRVVKIFGRTSQLAIGSALLGVLLSIIGIIMISTGITIHSIRALLSNLLNQLRRV